MTEDRRAHERINTLESAVKDLSEQHRIIAAQIAENTKLTRTVVDNTHAIVDIIKGARWVRNSVLWAAPVVAAALAGWEWFKNHYHG